MHLIYVDQDFAAALISEAAAHLPVGHSLGEILAVGESGIVVRDGARTAVFGADADGTWRVADLGDGLQEVTHWRAGVQLDRGVARMRH